MKKQAGFTRRYRRTKYPFDEIAASLGTVFGLIAGEDYPEGGDEIARRAAHGWAWRHTGPNGRKMRAITSIPPGGGKVEVQFIEAE